MCNRFLIFFLSSFLLIKVPTDFGYYFITWRAFNTVCVVAAHPSLMFVRYTFYDGCQPSKHMTRVAAACFMQHNRAYTGDTALYCITTQINNTTAVALRLDATGRGR